MPKYIYKAKQGPEKTIEGELLAESRKMALAKIENMGCTPVWVREKDSEEADGASYRSGSVKPREISVFTRQLAGLIKAGVPILKTLRIIEDQCLDRRLRRVIGRLEDDVRDGKMLSEALSKHPSVFPSLYVSMVRSGEAGGILDVILFRLSDALDREEDVRKKIQSAMAYPALVLCVGLITVFVMVTFFLPKIASLFKHFKDLPMPTQILIWVSEQASTYWKWTILPIVLVLVVFRRLTSGGMGRQFLDLMKLKLPAVGTLILQSEVARFSRTMSLLVDAGIPVEKALKLSAETFKNSVLLAEVEKVRTAAVQQGMSVAAGLASATHFPSYARNMIAVGEEGGRIDEAMADVASFYEGNVERQIDVVTSLIEPVLILVIGAVVGFIAVAMMLPVFAVTRSILQ